MHPPQVVFEPDEAAAAAAPPPAAVLAPCPGQHVELCGSVHVQCHPWQTFMAAVTKTPGPGPKLPNRLYFNRQIMFFFVSRPWNTGANSTDTDHAYE